MPPMGLALKQLVFDGAGIFFVNPVDLFFNPSTSRMWVADEAVNKIPSFNTTTQASDVIIDTSAVWTHGINAGRIIGDSTNIYACSTNGSGDGRYLIIANQTTGLVVGLCDVGSGNTASDQTLDGAGNVYVVAQNISVLTNGSVQKFSIAAAIAAYPTPVVSTATSSLRDYQNVAWDPTTSTVFATALHGGFAFQPFTTLTNNGGFVNVTLTTPEYMVTGCSVTIATSPGVNGSWVITNQGPSDFTIPVAWLSAYSSYTGDVEGGGNPLVNLNPSTLADVNIRNFPATQWTSLLSAFGSIWVATGTGMNDFTHNLLRVDPSTWPADGSFVDIPTATNNQSAFLSAETTSNTILMGVAAGSSLSRVFSSSNLLASTITETNGAPNAITLGGAAIWIVRNGGITRGVDRYTTTVGSESFIDTITGF